VTTAVLEDADPREWERHRYGLSVERWETLRDQNFWITGAGTGFGRALAVALACAGAGVFLTGRRESKLLESIEEAEAMGAPRRNCTALPADITSEEQIAAAISLLEKARPSLRGVVHSAAVPQRNRSDWPLQEESLEFWLPMLRTNLLGSWLVTKAAIPLMMCAGAARVIFLTSEAGWANTGGFGQYNVSKAALNSLGFSLAEECALRYPQSDVQMNVVVPGEARTEMNQGSTQSPYTLASLVLLLLSHPPGGPNGRFFHRDGRHLEFGYAAPYPRSL
jgi:3-oxoacyl-[acyl-carrier protein] reductase